MDAPIKEQRSDCDEQCVGPVAFHAFERGIDRAAAVSFDDLDLHPEAASGRFQPSQGALHVVGLGWIDEDGHTRDAGHQFAQKLQSLRRQLDREKDGAGQVAAWPGEARDHAAPDRVVPGGEDNRNRGGCGLSGECHRRSPG